MASLSTISTADVHKAFESGDGKWPARTWAFFDVREVGEAQKGHVPGATFLPRRMIEFRLPELLSALNTGIVIYDGGGQDHRALRAAETMAKLGYSDVSIMDGGLLEWQAAGFEVATGWNVPCKDFGERLLVSTDVPYMTADELAERIAKGENLGVFDVRTPEEYSEGSLPVSTSAPSFEWSLHVGDWAKAYDGVIIHCAGRTRSIFGTATGRLLGMKNLWALENGTMGWRLSNRDLASGQARTLPQPSDDSIASVRELAMKIAGDEGVELLSPSALSKRADERLNKLIYIFDTRDGKAFRAGHISHSIWLPGGQACQRADDFAAVPGADIVFVDDNDARAAMTAYWYRRMGFPSVFVLEGGVPSWQNEGLPIDAGRGRTPPLGLNAAKAASEAVSMETLAELLAANPSPCVVDVGKSSDFKAQHIIGADWIPRGYLEERIASVADVGSLVVVTAKDPMQAAFGAAALRELGYASVKWLYAPGSKWADVLPTETGVSGPDNDANDTLAIPYKKTKKEMIEYLEWEEELGKKYKRQDADKMADHHETNAYKP